MWPMLRPCDDENIINDHTDNLGECFLISWKGKAMKKLSILLMVVLMLAVCNSASAKLIGQYEAGLAGEGPADINPILQGWLGLEVLIDDGENGGNVSPFQPDGDTGYNGWQINDINPDGAYNGPLYRLPLTAADFSAMFDNGWYFKFRVRPANLIDGGAGFVGWGVATGSDPGWGLGTRERVGYGINKGDYTAEQTGTEAMTNCCYISGIDGSKHYLGTDSADVYHTVKCIGQAGESSYELTVDDVLIGTYEISDGSSNSSFDNITGFMSGSSNGLNRVTNWNSVVLVADPRFEEKASTPDPYVGKTLVGVDDDVAWAAPITGSVDHYVLTYRTDPNFTSPGNIVIDPAASPLDLGTLDFDTEIFWRVDVVTATEILEGSVWNFRTTPETPIIQTQPQSVTVEAGAGATLEVTFLNTGIVTWYKDGVEVSGENGTTLVLTGAVEDEGTYHCVVSNDAGSDTSDFAVIMTRRLVAYWDFEDGNLVDEADGWVGTFTDPNTDNEAPDPTDRFVAGYAGDGFDFAGDGLHVEVADTEQQFNFFAQGFTVACWVKAQGGTGTYSSMVAKHTYSDPRAGFTVTQHNTTGRPRMGVDGWGGMNGPATSNVQDGSWHHVVMSFAPDYDPVGDPDRNIGIIYVNGGGITYNLDGTTTWLRTTGSGTGDADFRWDVPLRIGCDDEAGVGSLDGIVDEVKIWSYALTPAEAAAEYTAYETEVTICSDEVELDLSGPQGVPDCIVDIFDFAVFASKWLDCNRVPDCN